MKRVSSAVVLSLAMLLGTVAEVGAQGPRVTSAPVFAQQGSRLATDYDGNSSSSSSSSGSSARGMAKLVKLIVFALIALAGGGAAVMRRGRATEAQTRTHLASLEGQSAGQQSPDDFFKSLEQKKDA